MDWAYDIPSERAGNCRSPGLQGKLDCGTLSMSTRHHPYDDEMMNEWNLHSLYGHMEAKATQEALRAARGADKRQFVLTRSSFAGTGRCA